jgi:pSer/pThr/pTyr-binding forkhead associated (FHA) protein
MAAPAARLAALTMAKLVLSSGGSVVFQCFVDKERLGIGRDPTNQIVINDPSVSREHAAIVAVGNDHILKDLASVNGTFVNGTRMRRRILQHGDVVEFGAFNLRYLNPKTATDVDLDRTMLIEGIAEAQVGLPAGGEARPVPRTRATRTKFPNGRVHMLSGPRAGMTIELDRVVATFGKPGRRSAVLIRRPHGYFLAHVEGRRAPRVNGQPAGKEARRINDGDVIEVADEKLQFAVDRPR